MKPLSDEARALLAACRRVHEPAPEDRDRVRRALAGVVFLPVIPSPTPSPASLMPKLGFAGGAVVAKSAPILIVMALVGGGAVVGGVGAATPRSKAVPHHTRARASTHEVNRLPSLPRLSVFPAADASDRVPSMPAGEAAGAVKRARPTARLAPPSLLPPSSSLEVESRAVGAALRALRDRDPSAALDALVGLESEGTECQLCEERLAARIRALLRLGRCSEAQHHRRDFDRRYPRSPLASAMDDDCVTGPPPVGNSESQEVEP